MDAVTRKIVLSYIPKWLHKKDTIKSIKYRPQVSYRPLVESRGSVPALPVKVSKKYLEEQVKIGIPKSDDKGEKRREDKYLKE